MDESPPTCGDQIFHAENLYEVVQVRWVLEAGVCRVIVQPVGAMYDADARK